MKHHTIWMAVLALALVVIFNFSDHERRLRRIESAGQGGSALAIGQGSVAIGGKGGNEP